jgi:peptide chain release factor 1
MIHVPTGLKQERQGRHRESNLRDAKQALIELLDQKLRGEQSEQISEVRKEQVGSGMRGDKIRTIRTQDNTAKDHRTGRSCRADKLMEGNFDLLW